MKISHFLFILTIFSILLASCSKEALSGKEGVIYELTFEVDNPLEEFENSAGSIVESPDDSSGSAVLVSGGCIIPHLFRFLGPFETDLYLTMCVEGATLDNGGGVSLSNRSTFEYLSIGIDKTDWLLYESTETLLVEQGDSISLNFFSGGIIGSQTYFDNLVITTVDSF